MSPNDKRAEAALRGLDSDGNGTAAGNNSINAEQQADAPASQATLYVGVVPFGRIWVDGMPRERIGIKTPIFLAPGKHTIAAGRSNVEQTKSVILKKGTVTRIMFELD